MNGATGGIDLALFARVVTSDPARTDGARAGRLEEFHAEDVFLTTEIGTAEDGTYRATEHEDGRLCIGLEWAEKRVLRDVSLQFADAAQMPPLDGVVVQYWSSGGREDGWHAISQTQWQGQWEDLPGEIAAQENRWVVPIDPGEAPEFQAGRGTMRIRWIFPAGTEAVGIRGLSAYGTSEWTTETFRVEAAPSLIGPVNVHIYNGLIIDGEKEIARQAWDPGTALTLKLRCSLPGGPMADRTLVRFEFADGGFSVNVKDALNTEGVYVEDYGIFVTKESSDITLSDYRRSIADRTTILERVREMPDQTFDGAWKALKRDIQNRGPTMLSLACDNRKFIVERNGAIRVDVDDTLNAVGLFAKDYRSDRLTVTPRFWLGKADLVRMDFGELGLDTTVRPSGKEGLPLRIGAKTHEKGVGLHANAELIVPLAGHFETFEAEVGLYPADPGGSAVFLVEVDGEKRFDSGVMKSTDSAKAVKVSLANAKKMALRLTDGGDGIINDAGNFAEARLIPVGAKDGEVVYLSDFLREAGFSGTASTRRLANDSWLPIIDNTSEGNGVAYTQRTYVAPYDIEGLPLAAIGKVKSLGVVELTVENTAAKSAYGNVSVDFANESISIEIEGNRLLVTRGGGLLACGDLDGWEEKDISMRGPKLELSGEIQPEQTRSLTLYIPAWNLKAEDHEMLPGMMNPRKATEEYWKTLLAGAMWLDVPEPLVEKVYLATQVHCMMAARNTADGAQICPWISSDRYGPLDTEAQAVVLGMAVSGQHEFARRSTDMFIDSYNKHGMLAKGYTLMGLGQHLWTMAEHYALSPDKEWLKSVQPKLLLASGWIIRQTEKTKRLDPRGNKVPEYGLVPPGVLADWGRYACYMYVNAHFQAGLKALAGLLDEIDNPEAGKLREAAENYGQDILNAISWNQARMPVLPLRDGTWVPATVSSIYTFGLTPEFFGGVSAIGHDVETGGHHIIPLGLIDAKSRQAEWIINYMEDRWFFIDGLFGAYPSAQAEADWFNMAGFAKLQPHYARSTDVHALRDDVKPFVRTYFNMFPLLLNMENLTYWEHFNANGGWNKTHESGWFLQMTRTMMLTERGNDLWLAPFVTDNWLKDGMKFGVNSAPTRFGDVGYEVKSSVADGYITATVAPPKRDEPENIVLRLRHPDGLKMKSVTVNGKRHENFDTARECITISATKQKITVRADYE